MHDQPVIRDSRKPDIIHFHNSKKGGVGHIRPDVWHAVLQLDDQAVAPSSIFWYDECSSHQRIYHLQWGEGLSWSPACGTTNIHERSGIQADETLGRWHLEDNKGISRWPSNLPSHKTSDRISNKDVPSVLTAGTERPSTSASAARSLSVQSTPDHSAWTASRTRSEHFHSSISVSQPKLRLGYVRLGGFRLV